MQIETVSIQASPPQEGVIPSERSEVEGTLHFARRAQNLNFGASEKRDHYMGSSSKPASSIPAPVKPRMLIIT